MSATLKFLGAARNVTGSRFLLQTGRATVLIDCGLYQERPLRYRNWDPFPVPPDRLDAVLLTHAHLDHCGLLPKLWREGFRGPIYCTAATAEIAQIVLEDSGHLQEEDAQYKRKRHQREGRCGPFPEVPLYTVDDAQECKRQFSPARYGDPIRVAEGVHATFHVVGHIFGAAFLKVVVETEAGTRTVVFSGDVGRWGVPILKDPQLATEADYLLIESTYGDRLHSGTENAKSILADVVNSTRAAGGNVVIPAFALERAQDILYFLTELQQQRRIPPMPIFLDGPMAVSVTEVIRRHPEFYDAELAALVQQGMSPFDSPHVRLTRTTDESKAISMVREPVVIMAGAGMCTGGRIKHHLVNNISRPQSTILFVGYQADGTLGREIVSGTQEVRIHGRSLPVRAKSVQIDGFSGHADRRELLQWLSAVKAPPRRAFVVHGEVAAAREFAGALEGLGWNSLVPAYEEEVTLS